MQSRLHNDDFENYKIEFEDINTQSLFHAFRSKIIKFKDPNKSADLLKEHGLNIEFSSCVNLNPYFDLINVTFIAACKEKIKLNSIEFDASYNALKLSIVFNEKNDAISYLNNFKKHYPEHPDPVYEACKLDIPS